MESQSFSRARLLMSAGALGLLGMPLLTALAQAASKVDPHDLEMLQSLVEMERAGIKAYMDAEATGLLSRKIYTIAERFKRDHEAHRDALRGAIMVAGAVPTNATAHLDYPSLKSERDILNFAKHVESRAASTYLSMMPDIKDRNLATVLASVLGVETAHVATLADALGEPPPYISGFVG